jgi:glycosyltransferase involved in cell wall biosynthesis
MAKTVVYFTDSDGFGGAEQVLLTTMAGLARNYWRPTLVYHPGPGTKPLVEAVRGLGVELLAAPRIEGKWTAMQVAQLVRWLRRARPAVFHAHLNWPLACRFGLVSAILASVPAIVATEHSFVEIPWRRSILAQQHIAAGVDRYIAVSHDIAARLRHNLGFPARKVQVVHNGISLRPFDQAPDRALRAAWTGPTDRPVVLAIARLHEQKGLHYLLDAATEIPEAVIVLAGDGPQRTALETQARSLGLGGRTIFLGYRQDIASLLANCDVFVLPSRFEGLPLSVLEAMAAGKPVIATAVGGTGEAVVDGVTGLLVPPADSSALTRALRTILSDPGRGQQLGAAGKAQVCREFTAEIMVERVTQLYDEVLDGYGAKHGRR